MRVTSGSKTSTSRANAELENLTMELGRSALLHPFGGHDREAARPVGGVSSYIEVRAEAAISSIVKQLKRPYK